MKTHIRVFGPLQTTTQFLSIGSTLCSNPKYAATLQNNSATIRRLHRSLLTNTCISPRQLPKPIRKHNHPIHDNNYY